MKKTPLSECPSIKQFFTRRRRISRAQRISHPQDISQIPQGFISLKKDDYNRNRLFSWCRKPGSNRYEVLSSRDFKSRASTNFAIPAFAVFILSQNTEFVKGFEVISSKEHRGYIPRYIHVSVHQRKTQRSVASDTDLHRCTNPFFCGIL